MMGCQVCTQGSHSQTGVDSSILIVIEPGLGARLGKRSLSDALRVKLLDVSTKGMSIIEHLRGFLLQT